MQQLKRTKEGYFQIIDNISSHGKVWFNKDEKHQRLVKPSRTAFIIYQLSSWWKEKGNDSVPWDNFLITENVRGGESQLNYVLNESTTYTFNLNEAAFILLGLNHSTLSTKYFANFDIEKHRDDNSRIEHIFWKTREYTELRKSNILQKSIDDIWIIDNKDLIFFGKEAGFFQENDKFNFSIRAKTRSQEKLIIEKLDEILSKYPHSKKSMVSEEISEWLKKTHNIDLLPSSIERNYIKNFRELKAEKKSPIEND